MVISQILIGLLANSRIFAKNRYFGCNEDGTPKRLIKRDFDFIGHRKIFYSISVCVIVAGLVFGVVKGFNYGIDFTGGTMMQIDMGQTVSTEEVTETLRDFDLNPSIVLAGKKKEIGRAHV